MQMRSLKDSFIKYCEKNNFEENLQQLKIVDSLVDFLSTKKNIFNYFFKKKTKKMFLFIWQCRSRKNNDFKFYL